MENMNQATLSNVPNVSTSRRRNRRPSRQSIQTLEFIHRFRHVTTRHVQLKLGHAFINTSHKQLTQLRAQGYIARHSETGRAGKPEASYYLTPEGLHLLQAQNPERRYRQMRSVRTDATLGERSRERYHALADVYAHFKRHYDGYFEFSSAFDITSLEYMPDETPDGYVRVTMPGMKTQHYFIEIYGWGRSNALQRRRLNSYLEFAESERWELLTDMARPSVFVVAGGVRIQNRVTSELAHNLEQSMAVGFQMYTTSVSKLDGGDSAIWRLVSGG
jgi:hypothetical protein